LLAALAATVVGLLGYPLAAFGIWIGIVLFIGNLAMLYEIGRSLMTAAHRRSGRSIAVGSSLGRLLLLGVLLAAIGFTLGREALLGACGGLLIAQTNLGFSTRRPTEAV
jgi:hypothetical protein